MRSEEPREMSKAQARQQTSKMPYGNAPLSAAVLMYEDELDLYELGMIEYLRTSTDSDAGVSLDSIKASLRDTADAIEQALDSLVYLGYAWQPSPGCFALTSKAVPR